MTYKIQPSERARTTLQKDIQSVEEEKGEAAKRRAENAELAAHRARVEKAIWLAECCQEQRKFESDRRLYSTGWVTWKARSGGSEEMQLKLLRNDTIAKRFLGIPYRIYTEDVQLHLRLEDTEHLAHSEPDFVVLFQPRSSWGARVMLGDPEQRGKEDYWHKVEVDSEEWQEIDRMLGVFEALASLREPGV